MRSDGSFDWTHLFDPEQALLLVYALFTTTELMKRLLTRRVALIGGGGGTLPMALIQHFGSSVEVEVVELYGQVLDVAKEYFGLQNDPPRVTLHEQDGLTYIAAAQPEAFDALLFDICQANAEDGAALEFPNPEFVDTGFLEDHVYRVLKPGGVFAMNILGNGPTLSKIATRMNTVFGDVHVLATDP